MGLDEALQTRLYREYWREIEKLYTQRPDQLDNFLRDFVSLDTKAQKQDRADEVYSSFRIAFGDRRKNPEDLERLLRRMVQFSRYHAAFTMETREFSGAANRLARLRILATTPAILMMKLLDGYEREYLDDKSLDEALGLIESYIVRRNVCGLQTNSYWRRFAELAYRLRRGNCLRSLKVNLHNLPDDYAFPSDHEFEHALKEGNLYGRRRICRIVLERLENADSRERTDTSAYTIEHIMPQNPHLSDDWKKMLGRDWKNVHETWMHRLGNLTLTAYNAKYSDRPFHEKQTIEHGFRESPLRLNKGIGEEDQWTKKEIKRRGQRLAKRAMCIWPSLKVRDEWIQEARVDELGKEQGDIEDTRRHMDDDARKLFDMFRRKIKALDKTIIEVARPRSVSYHSPTSAECFCEILPRAGWILALFPIAAEEAVKCEIDIEDATERQFFVYARHDAGCYVRIYSAENVLACKPLLRQALAVAGN